jgi:dihydrofolate reductase
VEIALIAALARNRAIGRRGALPWHLPDDLAHFKRTTTGRPVLMGRRTFEAIGRPLPRRANIVVSRDPRFRAEGCRRADSLDAGIAAAEPAPGVFVIGGQSVYEQLLPRADRLWLTFIEADVEGDAFFPEFDLAAFALVSETHHARDARHCYAFRTAHYERRRSVENDT